MRAPGTPLTLVIASALLAPAALASHDDHLRDEWSTFRGDPARTGTRGHADGPGTGEVLWSFRMPTFAGPSPPAFANEKVYVGGKGAFFAIDAKTGRQVWSFKVAGEFFAPPIVSGGAVYAGTLEGVLFALDAETGRELWRREFEDKIRYAPLVFNGTLYVGAFKAGLHALDPATGSILWTYPLDDEIHGDLVADQHALYFGTRGKKTRDDKIHAADPEGPLLLWSVPLPAIGATAPALDGSRIYWVSSLTTSAFDTTSGETLWQFHSRLATTRSPLVNEGLVYSVTFENLTVIHGENGEFAERLADGIRISSVPIIAEDTIYFGTDDGDMVAMSRSNSAELWRSHVALHMMASPALIDGILYVDPSDVELLAIDAGGGAQVPAAPEERVTPLPALAPLLIAVLFFGLRARRRGAIEPA